MRHSKPKCLRDSDAATFAVAAIETFFLDAALRDFPNTQSSKASGTCCNAARHQCDISDKNVSLRFTDSGSLCPQEFLYNGVLA